MNYNSILLETISKMESKDQYRFEVPITATNPQSSVEDRVDEIFQLYEDWGAHDYIGEKVTQTNHMLQAAMEAKKDGCDEEAILAAFFHDIGHLLGHKFKLHQMDEWGTTDHDKIGAYYLQTLGFSPRLCNFVRNHVIAKRYLVTIDPKYYDSLSEASKATFKYQGGEMGKEELDAFEKNLDKDIFLKFRMWEEKAKNIDVEKLDRIEEYRVLAIKLLTASIDKSSSNANSNPPQLH